MSRGTLPLANRKPRVAAGDSLDRAWQFLQAHALGTAFRLLVSGYRPLRFVAGQALQLFTPLALLLDLTEVTALRERPLEDILFVEGQAAREKTASSQNQCGITGEKAT